MEDQISQPQKSRKPLNFRDFLVGPTGFEPATPWGKPRLTKAFVVVPATREFPLVDREAGNSPDPRVPGRFELSTGR